MNDPSSSADAPSVNIANRLSESARRWPAQVAVAVPAGRDAGGKRQYDSVTFQELEEDSNRIAAGLVAMGVTPGTRLALLVRPGIDFITLVFALFKAGAVIILIDPGMGKRNLLRCLEEAQPVGFVALPAVHAVRVMLSWRFKLAKLNVTVGRRWFWRGTTLEQLRKHDANEFRPIATAASDPAAIIFTTGSTGPPKGVLYQHGNFSRQVDEIQQRYDIQPGEIDLPGFPLFALFNSAMGVTTVIPEMDFTRPAQVDPRNILEPVRDWNVTQAFGSPAIWNAVGRYCEQHEERLPTLRRILSAGAPVPPHVLLRMKRVINEAGEIHTPYGATEALPVASISASEVLGETAEQSVQGAGTCVGSRFPGIQWQVIRIDDGPLEQIDQVEPLATGEIGELIVRGPVVTSGYVTRVEANPLAKILDQDTCWHRMGDVGYLDDQDRFWFCGRKAHRVITPRGTLFTVPCEAFFNGHPRIYRSALVGVGPAGKQRPVIVVETWPEHRPQTPAERATLLKELAEVAAANAPVEQVKEILLHPSLPVDIRHNAKIFREQLAVWAAKQLGG